MTSKRDTGDGNASAAPARSPGSALAALSELVDRLGRPPREALPGPGAAGPAGAPATRLQSTPPRPLKAVVAFDGTWSRLRVEHRLRQALAQVPAGAGPLNSSHLVNRALEAMRDLSPAYLDAFMTHIDTLQWLAQASGTIDPAPRASAAPDERRRPAAKSRRKG